jgi:hypothetical protein
MSRHCEELSDEAISNRLLLICEIAALTAPGMAQASLSTRAMPVVMAHLLLPPAALVLTFTSRSQ